MSATIPTNFNPQKKWQAMDNTNPYQAPTANLATPDQQAVQLADRSQRLMAVFVDGIIGSIVSLGILFAITKLFSIEYTDFFSFISTENPFTFIFFLVVNFLLNIHWLKKDGQTIGKKLAKIKVVDLNNNILSLKSYFFKRHLPTTLFNIVPVIGGLLSLIDALFIFRKERRCIHDWIAGTKVIKVNKD